MDSAWILMVIEYILLNLFHNFVEHQRKLHVKCIIHRKFYEISKVECSLRDLNWIKFLCEFYFTNSVLENYEFVEDISIVDL